MSGKQSREESMDLVEVGKQLLRRDPEVTREHASYLVVWLAYFAAIAGLTVLTLWRDVSGS